MTKKRKLNSNGQQFHNINKNEQQLQGVGHKRSITCGVGNPGYGQDQAQLSGNVGLQCRQKVNMNNIFIIAIDCT